MKTAYVAFLKANSGTLIGGVKEHVSSPFLDRESAQCWLDTILSSNQQAKRDVGEHGIIKTRSKNPLQNLYIA